MTSFGESKGQSYRSVRIHHFVKQRNLTRHILTVFGRKPWPVFPLERNKRYNPGQLSEAQYTMLLSFYIVLKTLIRMVRLVLSTCLGSGRNL